MHAKQIDSSLIARINAGDETSFAELYKAYFTYLCVCATVFTHDPERAKEIVNDLFVGIWTRRETLRWPVHPYLMKALRNGCLNHLRSLKSQQRIIDAYRHDLLDFRIEQTATETPLQYTETAELNASVQRVAETLPEKCRIIFRLYFYEGFNAREIARELELNPSTVRVQLKLALDRIRRQLGPAVVAWLLWGPGR